MNIEKNEWNTYSGSAVSQAIMELAQESEKIICIVTPNLLSTQKLHDELAFFQTDVPNAIPLLFFPDWETLPYDNFSPHQDIISERLGILSQLSTLQKGILITSISTFLHQLPPSQFISKYSFHLSVGDTFNIEIFRERLQYAGYQFTNKVMEHGEFAIRGSIIDIFPMGSSTPFRLDLFDNEIDSIRLFDVDSQCSSEKIERIELLPAHEFPLDETGIAHFRKAWRNRFEGNPSLCPIYNAISEHVVPAGIEYYLPLFFENCSILSDYLPSDTLFFLLDDKEKLSTSGENFLHEIRTRYDQRKHDITHPLLSPEELFISMNDFHKNIQKFTTTNISYYLDTFPIDITIQKNLHQPFEKLLNYINQINNKRLLICAQTAGRRELLNQQLVKSGISLPAFSSWHEFIHSASSMGIIHGHLSSGFISKDLILITEKELWGEVLIPQRKTSKRHLNLNSMIQDLSELNIGTAVVHLEHGVGRFQGLQHIEHDNQINEFLVLEYAGGDKIYVPVTSLDKISRYAGLDPDNAPLHRLGNDIWQKEKKKAEEKIHDAAVDLLEIYAKREARKGFAYQAPEDEYQLFVSRFPFEETHDQKQAISHVIQDMQSEKPMDRLICGDVGFGKTEVAMRACFLAVQNQKQVCILVPTTLLAGQHYENFCDRFAEFGVNIELLSRFRTEQASKKVIENLKTGLVDIVIGTHKLFSKNIAFKNLGLLVIDEEHRFGVKQKEFIKSLRHEVDILSLTATPIPRTLNMSLSGLRDISVIATPPLKRLAIKTFVLEKNNTTIRDAIMREIMRGGQVFYLHNQVSSIQGTAEHLRKLMPEASIEIAHGQMPERQLEKIMSDFYHTRFQVLVCSTIIETGIDIPTANTIIIERADTFGLAQLHQLRGRVGRSHHQAYAYLLIPHPESITSDAQKRLDAITSIEDLGAGFTLATHDLEIRGAGELLGEEQSGNMHAIGFNLYMELLTEAVETLKSGKIPELNQLTQSDPEINLNISLIIPEAYMGDVHMRLVFYKRIAHAENNDQLDNLQIEMIDRFGLLPTSVKNLFRTMELKFRLKKLGIIKISAHKEIAKITFSENPNIKPEKIINLIQVQPQTYKLDGPSRLKCTLPNGVEIIDALVMLIEKLEK